MVDLDDGSRVPADAGARKLIDEECWAARADEEWTQIVGTTGSQPVMPAVTRLARAAHTAEESKHQL
jgi:hypothetical protein